MSRFAHVDAVVFDLDGTLLDRRLSFERFIQGQWQRFSDLLQSVEQADYVRAVIELDANGYGPRKELFAQALARVELSSELAATLRRDYRDGFPGACVLFPEAARTLSRLRIDGFRLGLITNGSVRMQSRKLACLSLVPAFDAVLISDAEGVCKPDPEIFRRALDRLGTTADRAVFVGDHPEVDIAGARRAGMRAVWRRDRILTHTAEADAIVDELGELVALLGPER